MTSDKQPYLTAKESPPPLPQRNGDPKRRMGRATRASDTPDSGGLINAVYPNAIECTGLLASAGVKGMNVFAGISALLGSASGFFFGGLSIFDSQWSWEVPVGCLFILISLLFLGFAITAFRLDLFAYRDEPILFNRKTKKVHLFRRRIQMSRPWRPWPLAIDTYDWNQITGEIRGGGRLVGGSLPATRNRLVLAINAEPTARGKKGKVIDQVIVGMEEQSAHDCVGRWEHIRRYMEEDGAPLQPGCDLSMMRGFSHRAAFARGGLLFLLPGFYRNFAQKPGSLIAGTTVLVILLPMLLPFSFFRWLAEATSRAPWWPPPILDEAGGAPLPESEVLAQRDALARAQAEPADTDVTPSPPLPKWLKFLLIFIPLSIAFFATVIVVLWHAMMSY